MDSRAADFEHPTGAEVQAGRRVAAAKEGKGFNSWLPMLFVEAYGSSYFGGA